MGALHQGHLQLVKVHLDRVASCYYPHMEAQCESGARVQSQDSINDKLMNGVYHDCSDVQRAKAENDVAVASVFVNPTVSQVPPVRICSNLGLDESFTLSVC
jgi:hypothetical protein